MRSPCNQPPNQAREPWCSNAFDSIDYDDLYGTPSEESESDIDANITIVINPELSEKRRSKRKETWTAEQRFASSEESSSEESSSEETGRSWPLPKDCTDEVLERISLGDWYKCAPQDVCKYWLGFFKEKMRRVRIRFDDRLGGNGDVFPIKLGSTTIRDLKTLIIKPKKRINNMPLSPEKLVLVENRKHLYPGEDDHVISMEDLPEDGSWCVRVARYLKVRGNPYNSDDFNLPVPSYIVDGVTTCMDVKRMVAKAPEDQRLWFDGSAHLANDAMTLNNESVCYVRHRENWN